MVDRSTAEKAEMSLLPALEDAIDAETDAKLVDGYVRRR